MQLGLDISTTTTGYAISTKDSIIDLGFVDLKKQQDISDKAWTLVNHIIKLAKFNAVVCFLCEHHIRIKPVLVGATTARKQLFGKSRIKGMTAKEFVKNRIEEKYDLEKFTTYNKLGNWDQRNMDAYDALVVSKYLLPSK